MSAATRGMDRRAVRVDRAKASSPPAPTPIEPAREAKEKEPNAFSRWWAKEQAKKPDWTIDGFNRSCERWCEFMGKKDAHDITEALEFIAHQVATDLRQRDVECKWIFSDKETGRPFIKITLSDRYVFYHEVAMTIPK